MNGEARSFVGSFAISKKNGGDFNKASATRAACISTQENKPTVAPPPSAAENLSRTVRRSRDYEQINSRGKSFPTLHRVFEGFPGIATHSVMLKPDRAGVFHPMQQPQHLRYIVRAAVQRLDQLFPARAASVRAVDVDAEQI